MTVVAGLLAVGVVPLVRWIIDTSTGIHSSRWRVSASTVITVLAVATVVPRDPVMVLVAFPLTVLGVVLAHIDVATHRLPDVLVLTAYPPLGALLIVGAVATGQADALLRSGVAAAICLAGYGAVAVGGAMGFGDAKLAGLLGLALGWVSWTALLAAGVLALVLAAVPALSMLLRGGRRARIAFAPFLLLGALCAVGLT